jgi:hypothetical protein
MSRECFTLIMLDLIRYKKQWRLFDRIRQEDVVQGSLVVDVFSMWSVPSLYKKQWRLFNRILQEDVVQGSSVVDVFSMWSVPSLYKKQWRLCERIREEDVVQGSSVVDVFSMWSVSSLYKKQWRLLVRKHREEKKSPTPSSLSLRRINEGEKKHKGLDIQQIYGHGSYRGPMPGVTVPADCRQ